MSHKWPRNGSVPQPGPINVIAETSAGCESGMFQELLEHHLQQSSSVNILEHGFILQSDSYVSHIFKDSLQFLESIICCFTNLFWISNYNSAVTYVI